MRCVVVQSRGGQLNFFGTRQDGAPRIDGDERIGSRDAVDPPGRALDADARTVADSGRCRLPIAGTLPV